MATHASITGAPLRATPSAFAAVHARYTAALARFNALPKDLEETDVDAFRREEEMYLQASHIMDDAVPNSWSEFTTWLGVVFEPNGGTPGSELLQAANDHARRLLDLPPVMGVVDLYALDRAMQRVDYLAGTVAIVSDRDDLPASIKDALRGVEVFLNEQSGVIDETLHPHRRALGVA